MRSVELVIKGRKVIDVGYRSFLLLNAIQHDIQRFYAFNVKADGQEMVLVRIQGEDDQIAQYIDFVRSNFPEHAQVREIVERSFEGQVMDAFRSMLILQFEQMNKAIPAILSIDKKQSILLEKQDAMLEKQDTTISVLKEVKEDTSAMLEKQDSMLEKQDSMLEKQDSMLEKQDSMLEKQDTTIGILKEVKEDTSAIKTDISGLRKDASESLYEKYEQLCREIAEIKATLSEIKAKAA